MAAFKKFGLIVKKENRDALEMTGRLLPLFKKRGYEVFLPKPLFSEGDAKGLAKVVSMDSFFSSIDLLISLGGDGTLLKGVRLLQGRKMPVIGIRMGSLGFLTDIPKEGVEKGLDAIFKGQFDIEERMKVRGSVFRKKKEMASYHALNDVVIHTAGLARISTYQISIDGAFFVDLKADGILVASPTGSTAYSLAAGGPIVDPKTHLMVITPICAQHTVYKPMVVSDQTEVKIEVIYKNSDLLLTADGQEQFSLEEGDIIHIKKSEEKAYFLKSDHNNYLKTLRNKLFLSSS